MNTNYSFIDQYCLCESKFLNTQTFNFCSTLLLKKYITLQLDFGLERNKLFQNVQTI